MLFRLSRRHVPLSSVSVVGGGKDDSEVNLRAGTRSVRGAVNRVHVTGSSGKPNQFTRVQR